MSNNLANCPKCGSNSLSSAPIGLRRKRQRTTCLNCGFQFDPTLKRRNKKALVFAGLIFAVTILIAIIYPIVNKNSENTDGSSQAPKQAKVKVIFDASEYNKISTKELTSKMGKSKGEDWNNETSKGTFKMKIYDYIKDDIYCGFNQMKEPATGKPKQRGNGQGSVYKLPNGRWRAEVVLGGYGLSEDGKKRKVTRTKSDFIKKKDALEYIPTLRNEKPQETVTLDYLHAEFLKTKKYDKLSKSQRSSLSTAWNRCTDIKFCKIGELTLQRIQATIDEQVKTYYPARDIKTILSHLYSFAIIHSYIDRNPTEYIELPENNAGKKDAFKEDEINAFWTDYEKNEFTAYILIMIYAGLRYGELSISKENIFLNEQYMVSGIKTDAGINRTIPIADKILPLVTNIYNTNNDNLIKMDQERFYMQYWETIERTGVRKLNPHCCRHTYFTRLAEAEIPTSIITTAGGHKDYRTTMGYTHIQIAKLLEAVNKI